MHFQIVPSPNISVNQNTGEPFRPSVFILLFDSVSRSSGIRSIPKTINILKENYGAFDFRGLNKVGSNSLPNGYAFLTGIRTEELPSVDFHMDEKLPSERPNYCHEYVDNSTFIGKNFTDAGYVSLMAEDWTYGVFKVPGCIGFSNKPTTHYLRPFYVRMGEDKMLREQTLWQPCIETYQPLMEYHVQFLKAYPTTVPKFSLIWITELAHNYLDGLFHVDDYFANFFQQNRQLFRESFVFMMSDHGMTFGPVRETKMGQKENGNPMLFFAVPESLSHNKQLLENLRTNSADRLISHFDVYTTLLDIATVAPRTNWTDF
uniref:Sulfatase N-terminal domain-containing protein n=1 Tax=Plectus sambesii TaxID=2011161 RepID=A0A914WJN5_9BILA